MAEYLRYDLGDSFSLSKCLKAVTSSKLKPSHPDV
jgi:hypothetical protein